MPDDQLPRAATGTDSLIAIQGVVVRLGGADVLSGIDLTIGAGEIVTVIGPNGAGKTTLVRAVVGLLSPDRGRIARHPGLRIGYMPQQVQVDPSLPLTTRRFLSLASGTVRTSVDGALAEAGAAHLADAPYQALSGGEAQRVLLARALIRDPDLMVLDEPVRGVDLSGQIEFYDLIGRIRRRRGCAVLMVSHDLHLVMAATDRVICLNHHICCAGRPEAVSEHPEYLALFGPVAARRLAVYTHAHDHRHDLHGEVVAP